MVIGYIVPRKIWQPWVGVKMPSGGVSGWLHIALFKQQFGKKLIQAEKIYTFMQGDQIG
jgi:hypothetical protein